MNTQVRYLVAMLFALITTIVVFVLKQFTRTRKTFEPLNSVRNAQQTILTAYKIFGSHHQSLRLLGTQFHPIQRGQLIDIFHNASARRYKYFKTRTANWQSIFRLFVRFDNNPATFLTG